MKYSLFIILLLFSCQKNNSEYIENSECINATITKTTVNCGGVITWGIKIDNNILPQDLTDSIPTEFQQEGLKVCVNYDTTIYPFECVCCYDGPYAKIISIHKAE